MHWLQRLGLTTLTKDLLRYLFIYTSFTTNIYFNIWKKNSTQHFTSKWMNWKLMIYPPIYSIQIKLSTLLEYAHCTSIQLWTLKMKITIKQFHWIRKAIRGRIFLFPDFLFNRSAVLLKSLNQFIYTTCNQYIQHDNVLISILIKKNYNLLCNGYKWKLFINVGGLLTYLDMCIV